MIGVYDISFQGQKVGQTIVKKEGLYYKFCCDVKLQNKGLFRVFAHCGGKQIDLGICVPEGEGYRTSKKVPVKEFPSDKMEFILTDNKKEEKNQFFAIEETKPFPMLQELERGRFTYQNGVPGILFTDGSDAMRHPL